MYLGIELGSTRIKGVVLNPHNHVMAMGSYRWQTEFVNGYWTYDLHDVWIGIRQVLTQISKTLDLSKIQSMGISAMMHGFLAFDKQNQLLTPFRTWKNVNTEVAAKDLSNLFSFNIPLRWSIAHLYQAILDKEAYISQISTFTTLAGYVHFCLTGKNVLGIGDASGMFPIDSKTGQYHSKMLTTFKDKTGINLLEKLPKIVQVGEDAGGLTAEGRSLLGFNLPLHLPFAPPEGDAQTGMVSTNALAPKTGNVSAGTSVFSMIVLEHDLQNWYPEIDVVQTPSGFPVAMVHANECTSRIDPWIELFGEAATKLFGPVNRDQLYEEMYEIALDEHSSLGRFMKDKLVEAIIDLKPGMDILLKKEKITVDYLLGHGGYFKSKSAGATIMSKTLGMPIRLLKTAGEGGPWGMAILAKYRYEKTRKETAFDDFMHQVFKGE